MITDHEVNHHLLLEAFVDLYLFLEDSRSDAWLIYYSYKIQTNHLLATLVKIFQVNFNHFRQKIVVFQDVVN